MKARNYDSLFKHKKLIESNPMHIATVLEREEEREIAPNLAVASDVRVIDDDKIIISVNEMINTQKNIQRNPNVVMTSFDKDWVGLRMFGIAKFYQDGEYYDFCEKTFFGNHEITPCGATKPKGAIVVTVYDVQDFK